MHLKPDSCWILELRLRKVLSENNWRWKTKCLLNFALMLLLYSTLEEKYCVNLLNKWSLGNVFKLCWKPKHFRMQSSIKSIKWTLLHINICYSHRSLPELHNDILINSTWSRSPRCQPDGQRKLMLFNLRKKV